MWYILWGPTTPHTKTYRKDPELNRMWEIFEHAWGSPETEENVSALSQLAITDGVMDLVEPPGDDTGYIGIEIDAPVASVAYGSESLLGDGDGGEHQEMEVEIGETSSVTTTEPEQTAESDIQERPDGMSPEEWNSFRTKYPRLAQPNPDGTQPDSMSPPATQPSPPSSAPSAVAPPDAMPPPAPPSPGTIERKKALMARLAELRWGDSKPLKK